MSAPQCEASGTIKPLDTASHSVCPLTASGTFVPLAQNDTLTDWMVAEDGSENGTLVA
jgi:hypothetical protein